MHFQEITPDTSGYLIAGYLIAFLVMGLYVVSLYLRSRNLNRDREMLEEMDNPAAEIEAGKRPSDEKSPGETVTKRAPKKSP